MTRRVLFVAALALILATAAAYVVRPEQGAPAGAPTEGAMATALGASLMEDLFLGHVPDRSGDVMLVPKPHRYLIGEWDLTTLGTDTPWLASSHPNPWPYLQRVPLIFYGPGHVPKGERVGSAVDISALAPTYASVVNLDDFEADGTALPELVDARAPEPPRVIFTLVIDGGGWNVLQTFPDAWPTIAKMRAAGTSYDNATIGSAPSITGALHATFGTGSYPRRHGLPGNQMRTPDGTTDDAWLMNADPRYLRIPTVSELWDEANGNKAAVATVSYEGWHLGMIGHGAQRDGADKDVAVLWESESSEWWINEDYYRLPRSLQTTDLRRLSSYEDRLDKRDALDDGLWYGHTLEQLRTETVRPGTPAFVRFTGDAAIATMRDEAIGSDAITDFMWVEMKAPDYAGHAWNMDNPEVGDVLFETDRQVARMKAELDRTVGAGNYIFAISADHGQQPLPDLRGGWRINSNELLRDIEARFGDVIEKITTVDIFVDKDAVADQGVRLADIASYVGTYTIGDNIPEGAAGDDLVPPGRMDEELFAGAFSTDYLRSLTPEQISGFGEGDYPAEDLSVGAGSTSGL